MDLIYRHLIVARRALIERSATPEQFRRLRQQVEAGQDVDEDVKHLIVHDTIRKTMKKVFGWAGHGDVETEATDDGVDPAFAVSEATLQKERGEERQAVRYQRQEGYVVSRIIQDQMPGGGPLPSTPVVLHHPGFESSEDALAQYMICANELHERFRQYSDRQFRLVPPQISSTVTLVTVVETPILAIPRSDQGLELICEFHQKSVFGHVDTSGFQVHSEIGEYPIRVPHPAELMTMMKTVDELMPQQGS